MNSSRRTFLMRMLNGLGITAIAPIAYAAVSYIYPPLAGRKERAEQFITDNPDKLFRGKNYATIKLGDKDAILFKKQDNTFEAMSLQCTHAGCTLLWQEQDNQFHCRCHGGIFRRDGSVAAAPPTEPLARLTVRHVDGTITVIDKPI
ncbi:MAG: Rieske (2Fe-2S) protein [Ignavibacteriae bacterium]|nr:Rieske (2Fe-2S) protein [Ignavibacteriota bacterium]